MTIRYHRPFSQTKTSGSYETDLRDESSQRASNIVRISASLGEHNIKTSLIGIQRVNYVHVGIISASLGEHNVKTSLIRDYSSNVIRVDYQLHQLSSSYRCYTVST